MNAHPFPDSMIVDLLTPYLNRPTEVSGADVIDLRSELIQRSGRPLLSRTLPVHSEVAEDRYCITTATLQAGDALVRVYQPATGPAELRIDVTTGGHDV